jgi:hypothetical protein
MNKFVEFLQKRPSDLTIRIWRVIFWLLYVIVLYYNFFLQENPNTIEDSLFWVNVGENTRLIISYAILAFWIFPIITWLTDVWFMKSKYVRIMELVYAIILFYFSHIIVEWPDLDVDILLFFLAFIPLIWWITWKFITKKGLNYGYKVTKIRV